MGGKRKSSLDKEISYLSLCQQKIMNHVLDCNVISLSAHFPKLKGKFYAPYHSSAGHGCTLHQQSPKFE